MPFATAQGCRIYYRLEGSAQKPLLVLVHALGTDHGLWDPQMPALLRYFQVLRLDLRGHGASDAPAGDYTIAQLAGDVLATVPRERFSYCGLSLGGMIGQWLGANHAQRIERLVLANTSPRTADPSLFEVRRKTVLAEGSRRHRAGSDGTILFVTRACCRGFDPRHAARDRRRRIRRLLRRDPRHGPPTALAGASPSPRS